MTVFIPPPGSNRSQAVELANAFLMEWLASLPSAYDDLKAASSLLQGPPLDHTDQSFTSLADFVFEHAQDRVEGVAHRLEDRGAYASTGWSGYGLRLVDGLIAYVTIHLQSRLNLEWEVLAEENNAYDLQPVPRDQNVPPPWRLVQNALFRRLRGGEQDLGVWVRGALERAESFGMTTTEQPDQSVTIEVSPSRTGLAYDYEIYLPEDADTQLGPEVYASLEDIFESVDGVAEVLGQDRELFLARVEARIGGGAPTLRRRLQEALDRAVADRR